MSIKPDTGIDISDWQKGLKIASLNPLPRFGIVKATEGVNWTGETTVESALI